MKRSLTFTLILNVLLAANVLGQSVQFKYDRLEAVGVNMSIGKLDGKQVVRVVKDSSVKSFDEPMFVRLKGYEFKDGTIELKVLSRLLTDAPASARGFIGLAFRINESNSRFESIYIRPTNGRADDQVRRNHSTQYVSHPDYLFDRLRQESPEKYESYADMGLNEWIKMKVIVKGAEAKLYLNDSKEPVLIVNDLKMGADQSGGIGLFVGIGTEGYFADVKISTK